MKKFTNFIFSKIFQGFNFLSLATFDFVARWNLQEDPPNVLITGDTGAVENFIVFFEKENNEFEPKEPATIESAPTSSGTLRLLF